MPDTLLRLWLVLAMLGMSACTQNEVTTVFLVRHAEKVEPYDTDDPPLTVKGRARAASLLTQLSVDTVHALYSTDYRRTRQTLMPIAEAMQTDIRLYEAHDYEGVAERIRREHSGENVVVSGHSNTILPIIEALGSEPPLDSIGHQDYDYIFKVSLDIGHAEEVELMNYQTFP